MTRRATQVPHRASSKKATSSSITGASRGRGRILETRVEGHGLSGRQRSARCLRDRHPTDRTGQVSAVKVLGVLAMIDDDETDWKVVVRVASNRYVVHSGDPTLSSRYHEDGVQERQAAQ